MGTAAAPIPGPDVVTVSPRQKFGPQDTDCHDLSSLLQTKSTSSSMTFLAPGC